MGSDLYNNLIRYFTTHLGDLKNVSAGRRPCCHSLTLAPSF